MNFKLVGTKLINGDIISPEIPYAEFSCVVSHSTMLNIVANLNYGHELLMIYKEYRDNMHIASVVSMLEKMEGIFAEYDYELHRIMRIKELSGGRKSNETR